jgi:hypothetical protein
MPERKPVAATMSGIACLQAIMRGEQPPATAPVRSVRR